MGHYAKYFIDVTSWDLETQKGQLAALPMVTRPACSRAKIYPGCDMVGKAQEMGLSAHRKGPAQYLAHSTHSREMSVEFSHRPQVPRGTL